LKNKIYIIVFSILFSVVIWGSVTLSDQYFSSMNFNVKVINLPKGYSYGNINPDKVIIRLKANGWQLLNLNLKTGKDFFVSADNDSGLISVDPFNEITQNTWLGSGIAITEIFPKKISFQVEEIALKKIKVEPVTDLDFQSGYGLATPIRVYPDSILVSGPKTILSKTESIRTYPLSISRLDSKVKIITDINIPAGFETLQKQAEITLDVQKIVERSFDEIKVNIVDIPSDRDIVLIPNIISVSLRGGVNLLGKISPDEINTTVNYRDIILDTLGSVKPKIDIPENTQLLFSKPDKLKYVIKKFE
jgi:hypothetical protein